MDWISVNDELPFENHDVWIAGEMKYEWEQEMTYFVGIGWVNPIEEYEREQRKSNSRTPQDVDKWSTLNDWYEGQHHYRITHWMEMEEPKHPINHQNK